MQRSTRVDEQLCGCYPGGVGLHLSEEEPGPVTGAEKGRGAM